MAIVGIDLGTTYSLVAVWTPDGARLIPNALGSHLTPSAVGIDDDGRILIGEIARERLLTHPRLTVHLFKRDMGLDKTYSLGNRIFRPEELSALVLRSLKEDAEHFLGESVTEAVISVPAYFNDAQRKATRNAGLLAGLKVERLINEPTAAALAYGLHRKFEDEALFLIFDLGGGTFDVSLLEYFNGVMEVHAIAGDNYLGGEDFTRLLIGEFLRCNHLSLSSLTSSEQQTLYIRAEACKKDLAVHQESKLIFRAGEATHTLEINAAAFKELSGELLERIRHPLNRVILDAGIKRSDLADVILVGGATRMSMIKETVSLFFNRIPSSSLNPDEVVCLGAAIQAGLKARDQTLREVILTDVCPHTMGTEVVVELDELYQPGYYLPIIERNTTIPTSKEAILTTVQDNQTELRVKIYEGEHRLVKENIYLGSLTVKIPPAPKGSVKVNIRYTYDINGILEVLLFVPATGENKRLIIEENPGEMDAAEIESRLQELQNLKIHPRDQAVNRALMARGERLYEEHLGDIRLYIGNLLAAFDRSLESQERKIIKEAREALKAELDRLEQIINNGNTE